METKHAVHVGHVRKGSCARLLNGHAGFGAFSGDGGFAKPQQQSAVHAVLSGFTRLASFHANQGLICEVAQRQQGVGEYGDIATVTGSA